MRECDYCQHVEMCCWRKELEERGCDFFDDGNKWIPVSERLPSKEEYIANNGLFIVTDGNRTYAEYFDVYNFMKYFGEPTTMNGFRVDRCVIAWMPLPKPYESQERSRNEYHRSDTIRNSGLRSCPKQQRI